MTAMAEIVSGSSHAISCVNVSPAPDDAPLRSEPPSPMSTSTISASDVSVVAALIGLTDYVHAKRSEGLVEELLVSTYGDR